MRVSASSYFPGGYEIVRGIAHLRKTEIGKNKERTKQVALGELLREAKARGANGVAEVSFEYGGGGNMNKVTVKGRAVALAKKGKK